MADQRRCVYGWVLPDKCQAIDPEKGCPCGDYPPRKEKEHPKECKCETCRYWGA